MPDGNGFWLCASAQGRDSKEDEVCGGEREGLNADRECPHCIGWSGRMVECWNVRIKIGNN